MSEQLDAMRELVRRAAAESLARTERKPGPWREKARAGKPYPGRTTIAPRRIGGTAE